MGYSMAAEFHHVAISVEDMEKALKFYKDILGFEVLWTADKRDGKELSNVVGLKDVETKIVMLTGYGAKIELFHYTAPRGVTANIVHQCDYGLTHFALNVQGIHDIYDNLVEKGVTFNCPPQNIREGAWATYMKDFEGNTIELVQYDDTKNN